MGQLQLKFDYGDVVTSSVQVAWRIEDVLPDDTVLSFERPHLPRVLTAEHEAGCLDAEERTVLNHIRGNAYMNLFAFVEEYIIAQTVNHAQAEMFGDHDALRALLRFSEEELKHQKLFRRYCSYFERDFPTKCEVLGSAAEVANVILSHSPLAVMLVTLHFELMTQQHYADCVRDDTDLDPLFSNILKHHWLEEAQHAKIDVLEIDHMLEDLPQEGIEKAVEEYFGILEAVDGLLAQQVDMDIDSLSRSTGRTFTDAERDELRASQRASNRRDVLLMGLTNPQFVDVFGKLSPGASARRERATKVYAQ